MSYEVEQNDVPKIIQAETRFFLRFKPKDGIFSVYDREKKEPKDAKTVKIIKISDSRFTVKAAQNEVGAFIFSGLYRDARNTITVLEKKDGKTSVIAEGSWQAIKTNPNLKYTKVVFCLFQDGKKWHKAQFDFSGISAIQWGKVSGEGVLTLVVSKERTFETPRGNFYAIEKSGVEEVDEVTDGEAKEFAKEIAEVYASYDASAKYYAEGKMSNRIAEGTIESAITEQDLKEVGLIDDVNPEAVPF